MQCFDGLSYRASNSCALQLYLHRSQISNNHSVVRISSDSEESRPARECPAQFDLRSYCENKVEPRDDTSELSGWRNEHFVLQVNPGSVNVVVAVCMVLREIAGFATHANLCFRCTTVLLLVLSQTYLSPILPFVWRLSRVSNSASLRPIPSAFQNKTLWASTGRKSNKSPGRSPPFQSSV